MNVLHDWSLGLDFPWHLLKLSNEWVTCQSMFTALYRNWWRIGPELKGNKSFALSETVSICAFNIVCCVGCTWGAGLGSGGGLLSMAGHHWTLQWRGCISREEDGGVLRPESVLSGEMNEGAEVKLHAVRVDIAHIKLHIHTDRQYSNNATFSRQDPSVWYQLSTQVLHKSPANIFFWHRTKSFFSASFKWLFHCVILSLCHFNVVEYIMFLVDVAIEPTSTHCDSCLCFFRSVWKPWNHSLPSPNASVPNPSPSSWPTERPSSSPCRSVCLSVWFLTYTGLTYCLYLNLESSMWCTFCFDVCLSGGSCTL